MAGIRRWASICDACDGTGERDWLEGGFCYECGGSGLDDDEDDEYGPADVDFWEVFYDGADLAQQENTAPDDRRAFRGDRITPAGSQDEPFTPRSPGSVNSRPGDGTGDDDE